MLKLGLYRKKRDTMKTIDWKEDVKASVHLMETENPEVEFKNHSKIYNIADLNHKALFQKLKTNGTHYLGVMGSTDPMFNAIFSGYQNIMVFDINALNVHFMFLKIAALLSLSYEEYLNYFYSADEDKYLSKFYFDKLKNELPTDSLHYWETLYTNFKNDNFMNLFYSGKFDEKDIELLKKVTIPSNQFLTKENYLQLQHQLKIITLTYYVEDFANLLPFIKEAQYDFMYLGNLHNYSKETFYFELLKKLESNLVQNGILQGGFIHWYFYEENPMYWEMVMQQFLDCGYKKATIEHVPEKNELQDIVLYKRK